MSYDEAHHKRSRVVVETPAARREVVETRTAYAAPDSRRGVSTGVVAIVAIAAVVLTAIVAWAMTRPSADEVNANVRVAAQPTPITQVVTVPVPQQQPVVMPAPATTTTTTQPVIVPVPSTTSTSPSAADTARANGTDDGTIQSNIERKFSEDTKVAALGVTVSVIEGKVTLIGTVDSREMKNRLERMARIKGVKSVDNQIIVTGSADSSAPSQ
jgi:hypothetical protein